MVKFEMSVMIDHPIEEVWKFLTDLSNVPKWETEINEVRQNTAGQVGVGSTFEIRRKNNMTLPERVTEFEPNRKFTFVVTSGPAKESVVTYSVETVEGKVRFTSSGDFKFNGFYKLITPFVSGSMKREELAAMGNLKRILESETK